ncbi:MAG: hypothetical protein LCH83_12360 [Proteobacteria bacterium]|nr:hypothetical protein [Pseudomonadota bacterium]
MSRPENMISEITYLMTLLKDFTRTNSYSGQTGEYNLLQDFSDTEFLGQQSIDEEVITIGGFIK